MKKIIICIIMLSMAASSFSQQSNPSHQKTREDYLLKSKKQRSLGWVLLAGGAAFIIAGDLIGNSNEASFGDAGTGIILAGLGVIAMIVSVPVFLAAGKNKRRGNGMTASIILQNGRAVSIQGLMATHYPALSLRIRL